MDYRTLGPIGVEGLLDWEDSGSPFEISSQFPPRVGRDRPLGAPQLTDPGLRKGVGLFPSTMYKCSHSLFDHSHSFI